MPAPLERRRASLVRATVCALGLLLGMGLVLGALSLRAGQVESRFDLFRWEIETVPNRWLAAVGAPFWSDMDDDEVIAEYFSLPSGHPRRDALENRVERIVEGRIDRVLQDVGLNARLPLPFTTFPPVDIELAISPRVLVVSPRHVVERDRTELLRPDIPLTDAIALEQTIEVRAPAFSALVVGSGGVATYPAVVSDRTSYAGVLSTAAHEWVHHYLAFYPLGIRYAASADLRTINETVADLVGQQIALIALERWGDPTRPEADTEGSGDTEDVPRAPVTPSTPTVDRVTVLRDLRLEVDALLAQGRIEDAERLMEETRLRLEEAGIFIRRINQAFFAWYGTYAARPDATDPLGGHLREVMALSGSLPSFLEVIRGVGSRQDVIEVLTDLGGLPPT